MNWKMMMNNYDKALSLAQNKEITNALNMLYPYIESMLDKKLYGLLLYCYGDYEEAYRYLKDFPEYSDDIKEAVEKFKEYKEKIVNFVNENKFKQALDVHHNLNGGSITEKNIEGCLYALCGKKEEAEKSFLQAILMDKGSNKSAYLLESLSLYKSADNFGVRLLDKIKAIFKAN